MAAERRICTIARSDGTSEILPVRPKVEALFERVYKVGIPKLNEGQEGATNVYRLAYEVDKEKSGQGPEFPAFIAWLETVDGVDIENEPIVPLVQEAQPVSSPASPSQPE